MAAPLALAGCSGDDVATGDTFNETSGDGDGDSGDGDGDPGDGDGDPGDGDGDTGDGDGDTGDGDGDTGDGDGDTGDGDTGGVCGDGVVNGDEECDDGNPDDTDECLSSCLLATCGDGIIWEGNEECDDGNPEDGDECTNACTSAVCGDGAVQAGVEECDDGNDISTDDCTTDCVAATCGDGIIWEGNEECDDGNDVSTDDCTADCAAASCGDAYVWEGNEACDDGVNDGMYGGCEMDCQALAAYCGDGNVDMMEECDDGNDIDDDGCANDCTAPPCGNNCFAEEGCLTEGGRCIRLTCTQADNSATVCDSCMGWSQVTYQNWLNDGYCEDVIATYRDLYDHATMCGNSNLECCANEMDCSAGSDNAWHFHNGQSNYYTGPCLGCQVDANCTYWNNATSGTYSRLTACEAP
ncbi:DUF4215 domain-containing protein [Enhygromyxa salina]|uniref:DUF4215 domain-containing protein n=1 Tax=Enhygromyxa salina TaxID=215803 RepID=UPI0015E5C2BB|nr:DUF4215 domain-containing protein [Enhygromyxa salina]